MKQGTSRETSGWPTRPQPIDGHYFQTWCPVAFYFPGLGVFIFVTDGRTDGLRTPWPWPFGSTKQQVSLMIHSARSTVLPVVNNVFAWNLFRSARFWKLGTDGRTTRAKTTGRDMTVGRPSGSIERDLCEKKSCNLKSYSFPFCPFRVHLPHLIRFGYCPYVSSHLCYSMTLKVRLNVIAKLFCV